MSAAQVSIIIPCYELQHYLQEAFDSISQQTYRNIEVVVVDDGSCTPVVLPTGNWWFETRLIRQKNAGLSSARNAGLAMAKGRYVKFLDADDRLLPDCISSQVASMGGRDDVISVIGYYEEDEASGRKALRLPAFGDIKEALLQVNIGPPHCYLFSLKSAQAIGGFSTCELVRGGHEDYDFVLRIAATGSYGVTVHKAGVVYLKRPTSMSHQYQPMVASRARVWAQSLEGILNTVGPGESGHLLAALFSWSQIVCSTPDQYCAELFDAGERLLTEIKNIERFPEKDLQLVVNCLAELDNEIAEKMVDALSKVIKSPQRRILVSQDLLDWRIAGVLHNSLSALAYDVIKQLFAINGGKQKFAIYGAGEIGMQLARELHRVGLAPAMYIDQSAGQGETVREVPVFNLDDERISGVDYAVIASDKFYGEMANNLLQRYPHIKLLN